MEADIIAAARRLVELAKIHDAQAEQMGMDVLALVDDALARPLDDPAEVFSRLADIFIGYLSQDRRFCGAIQSIMGELAAKLRAGE